MLIVRLVLTLNRSVTLNPVVRSVLTLSRSVAPNPMQFFGWTANLHTCTMLHCSTVLYNLHPVFIT